MLDAAGRPPADDARAVLPHAALGGQVEVGKLDGHQKRLPATVSAPIFYDPDKSRVRA